jgi:hypothetical protein
VRSKWLDWTPSPVEIMPDGLDTALTKPPKPSFVSFGSSLPGWFPIIPSFESPVSNLYARHAQEKPENRPSESLEAARRFGQPHAKLFPLIGRKVRTPSGPGTLLQVFAGRATVVLDSEVSLCKFFRPPEIQPVSCHDAKKKKNNSPCFESEAAYRRLRGGS